MLAFWELANLVNKCSTKARKMHHKPCSISSIFTVIAASDILWRIQKCISCTRSRSGVVHVLKHLFLNRSRELTAVAKRSADVLLIKKCVVMPSLMCLHLRFAQLLGVQPCIGSQDLCRALQPHTGVTHRGTLSDTCTGSWGCSSTLGSLSHPNTQTPLELLCAQCYYFQLLQRCVLCSLGWCFGMDVWDDPSYLWWCLCVHVGSFHRDFNDTCLKVCEVKLFNLTD